MISTLPVSVVIPTRDRAAFLQRALDSLLAADLHPSQIVIVDGSEGRSTHDAVRALRPRAPHTRWDWAKADRLGAAVQRNQGVALGEQPYLWFMDDDVVLQPDCGRLLWRALDSEADLGGASAMIINQKYQPPGRCSAAMFAIMNGRREPTYAGRVLGPAVNLLPADDDALPEVVPVEWLNTTCTMYRRDAIPAVPFDPVFTGYSLMEDLALSLRVSQHWKLANVRSAKVFHDSQPGTHKADPREMGRMELVNRHYVMTRILHRTRPRDYARLALWELFQLAAVARSGGLGPRFWRGVLGKIQAVRVIAT